MHPLLYKKPFQGKSGSLQLDTWQTSICSLCALIHEASLLQKAAGWRVLTSGQAQALTKTELPQ